MSLFDLAAVFLVLMGAFGWANVRWFRLPSAAAMLLAGIVGAVALWGLRVVAPAIEGPVEVALWEVDFPETVLDYLLAFLLFAGAMQVNLGELRRQLLQVSSLATVGVLVSTAIIGVGLWALGLALHAPLSLPWALVFGALISPTDPVAVLAAVGRGGLSKELAAVLQGEALFNDGVGIVVFTALVAMAASGGEVAPLETAVHVVIEAAGGLALGFVCGWAAIRAMRAIDDYAVEVTLSLALATAAYSLAGVFHVSGPIAVGTAGLLIGDYGVRTAMSDTTQRYLRGFWHLVDEILNAMLFLLLGLELFKVAIEGRWAGLWLGAIPLVVAARAITVLPWGAWLRHTHQEKGAGLILAWGGLHGALSMALALSLPESPARNLILSVTYAVVVFSVLAQGLTFSPVVRRLNPGGPGAPRDLPGEEGGFISHP